MKLIYSRQHFSHDPDWLFDNSSDELISHYEKADRIERIFTHLVNNDFNNISPPEEIILKDLESIHDRDFLSFLSNLAQNGQTFVPDSFSNIRFRKKPRTVQGLLGYYCTDVQTPFSSSTYSGVLYYRPGYIVISFGTDTCIGDPIGKFCLKPGDYHLLGEMIRQVNVPLLVIQEGGYMLDTIGECVFEFLSGIEGNIM